MGKLGAHESVGGGLHLAFERIHSVGGESLQIFTRNQRQWNPAPLGDDEVAKFTAEWKNCSEMEVVSHGSYLINLATEKQELLAKSIKALQLELERCQTLGIEKVVLHPGSHGGSGAEEGIARFVKGLDATFEKAQSDTKVLVETTAGQGTGLGAQFEEIRDILAATTFPDRVRVCVDTCHIFAAGYDIRSEESYQSTMNTFDELIGLDKIEFFHLNDSKKDLGSRVDRHAHIGEGAIGCDGFSCLVNDPRFASHGMTLETPKDKDLEDDRRNLKLLRSMINTTSTN